jgi:hypothetical protein
MRPSIRYVSRALNRGDFPDTRVTEEASRPQIPKIKTGRYGAKLGISVSGERYVKTI